jgi:DNA-binding IclR family transcriptional regulator
MHSRLNRLLAVLDAFADGSPTLSAEQICTRTGNPIATGYRHIRELCDAGLLVRLPHGYAPGPRIIEWDCMVRDNDPLLAASRELVNQLVADTGLELLLSQLYGERVVNVHYEHSAPNEPLALGRGRVMPLFRGSTSRVILAEMPARQLRRVFDAHLQDTDAQAIGGDWKQFSKALAAVRRRGYEVSSGELYPGRMGIAAPIFADKGRVLGSLTLIGAAARLQAFREDFLSSHVLATAREITRRLAT